MKHVGDNYIGTGETRAWYQQPFTQTVPCRAWPAALCLHRGVRAREALHAHHAQLAALRSHAQTLDQRLGRVSFPINGGRDGGYRGYTIKRNPIAGEWRVDFATADGHLLGRERFTVDSDAVDERLRSRR